MSSGTPGGRRIEARELEEIGGVESCGAYLDEYVVGAGLGRRAFKDLESVVTDDQSAHASSLGL